MNSDDGTRWRTLIVAAALLATPLLVYLLAFGPVYWLAIEGYIDAGWAGRVYWPIVKGCDACGLDSLLVWYLGFWGKP